ncbi:hypothetical protein [Bacteroides sp. 519]|uniref:hypothetical protein n=1 Tax=Bacteroides sp. 519 TaxID=2302937 RepID=UPI0013D4CCA5|nr:hypothetical protein [Bacteroides sp. 519]NDV59257.1 hypothetical protein [Bacteroides sp. 519]
MQLYASIRKLIAQTSGLTLTRPSEFEALSESVFEKTGERLSVNTLKRLFGVINEVKSTPTTLNIIARYLGYSNWQSLLNELEDTNSGFAPCPTSIHLKDLPVGTHIDISYSPDRQVLLEVVSTSQCRVIKVNKGKLQVDDILDIDTIVLHAPFIVKNVRRNGMELGAYTGGQEGGVLSFEIVPFLFFAKENRITSVDYLSEI